MDLSNVKKEVAINNVEKLLRTVERTMDRFESSPNFRIVSYENNWINHPDEFFVDLGCFKHLLKDYFGDIKMQHFLTEYKFNTTTIDKLKDFRDQCDWLCSLRFPTTGLNVLIINF